jgi:hypothetical protein
MKADFSSLAQLHIESESKASIWCFAEEAINTSKYHVKATMHLKW